MSQPVESGFLQTEAAGAWHEHDTTHLHATMSRSTPLGRTGRRVRVAEGERAHPAVSSIVYLDPSYMTSKVRLTLVS
ncbi:hypothetical protein [Sorangium sp. So ce1000]|uniref:hypothetical protein n=1 Tax=Sorangium sp. So ce1000 TaxID=3133325 RepID=UPI003F5EF9CD